jgi:predicted DCC family thiol-disulfide oxidoreductase YuxK
MVLRSTGRSLTPHHAKSDGLVVRSIDGMDTATVFFDEDCGFCRWSADRLRSWDRAGRLRFATIQGPEGDRVLGDMDPATRLASWHLVSRDGRRWSAGAAVAPTIRLLPGGRPLAVVFALSPWATERLYQWTVRHRLRLGALLGQAACSVDPSRSAKP